MATRKISDLTLLDAGQVSSSDTLLLLDNSDPTDQNKRSAVGSIFTAVPSGTYTSPGVRFEGKTSTGVFSETQGQVGLAMGNARLNLQKVGTTLNIQAKDDADQNLDFTISAQGTGVIRLGSTLAINDLNFIIPNSIDDTKVAKFSSANLTPGQTNIYSFPSNEGLTNTTDELTTLKATQTLENKTIVSPTLTGTLSIQSVGISGNTTIGDEASDSLTVNAASVFAASATFSNSMIINQGMTVTGDMIMNSHIDMVDDKSIKMGTDDDLQISYNNTADASYITNTGASGLKISSDELGLYKANHTDRYVFADATNTIIYHNNSPRITTSASGMDIGGTVTTNNTVTASSFIKSGDTSSQYLMADGSVTTGGGNTQVSISDTVPAGTASAGDLWWESDTGRLKIYYQDTDSAQWVDVNPPLRQDRIASTGAPSSATDTGVAGDIRYDSGYVYIAVGTNTWKRAALTTW